MMKIDLTNDELIMSIYSAAMELHKERDLVKKGVHLQDILDILDRDYMGRVPSLREMGSWMTGIGFYRKQENGLAVWCLTKGKFQEVEQDIASWK